MNGCVTKSRPHAAAVNRSYREKLCRHHYRLREGGGGFIYEQTEYSRSHGSISLYDSWAKTIAKYTERLVLQVFPGVYFRLGKTRRIRLICAHTYTYWLFILPKL